MLNSAACMITKRLYKNGFGRTSRKLFKKVITCLITGIYVYYFILTVTYIFTIILLYCLQYLYYNYILLHYIITTYNITCNYLQYLYYYIITYIKI